MTVISVVSLIGVFQVEFESFGPSDLAKLVWGAIVHLFSFVGDLVVCVHKTTCLDCFLIIKWGKHLSHPYSSRTL